MLVHCNMRVRPDEIWFLFRNDEFTNRRLEMATCPKCENTIARLVETRITDGKIFDSTVSRRKAKRLINEHRNEIDYSSLSFPKGNKVLYGFRYGENIERTNKKTGESTIIQKACDFYGNKEQVKKI